MKRGRRSGKDEQVPTRLVSLMTIMRDPAFALGVRDARARLPYRATYDLWTTNSQWNYERGRQWAALAPRELPLNCGSQINPDAVRLYGDAIR
ncbi:hypothetical protein ACVWXO_005005 [Bradyrhizobium sp. LM2.7]